MMLSMVSSTGTLVNSEDTSYDTKMSCSLILSPGVRQRIGICQ